jgi:hypothetical protein
VLLLSVMIVTRRCKRVYAVSISAVATSVDSSVAWTPVSVGSRPFELSFPSVIVADPFNDLALCVSGTGGTPDVATLLLRS